LYARWYTIQLSLYKLYKISNKPTTWPTIIPLYYYRQMMSSTLTTNSTISGPDSTDGSLSYNTAINYVGYLGGLGVRSFKMY
jgi:hypothetical protein